MTITRITRHPRIRGSPRRSRSRAAARQSVPRPGSGRSPPQHGDTQGSITIAAGGPSSARRVALQPAARPAGARFRRLVPPAARVPRSRRALAVIAAAELVRQPAGGARPRGRSRLACGVRPRPRRSLPATARPWPTAPRRGSPLRWPARRQAARGPTAAASNRPTPAARCVPWRGRAQPAASARSRGAGRGTPQGPERHRPPLLRDRRDVVLPLCPRRAGQDICGAGLEG